MCGSKKLAVVSDVHANLVALDAVLADLEGDGIDTIVALGDMIQGGPQPAQTVARLRELGCHVVMGNSDAWLLSGSMTGNECFTPTQLERLEASRRWSLDQLGAADRAYVEGFRPAVALELAGGRRLLGFHGSPADFDLMLLPHTPEEEFTQALGARPEDVLCGGHVHLQFLRRLGHRLFFNPGSVGVTYDHVLPGPDVRLDPWAEYAVLHVDDQHRVRLEFRRTPFDLGKLVRAYRQSGKPFAEQAIAQYAHVA